MTQTAAQAVLDRIEVDEAFANRLKDAGGSEPSLAILRSEGFDVSREEMRDAALDRYGESLTAEQLDAIAGGEFTADDAIIAGGVITGFMTAGLAAAGAAI